MSVRFEHSVTLRCQSEVSRAIAAAAVKKHQKPAEWLRQAVLSALCADGINPSPETAGADLSSQRSA